MSGARRWVVTGTGTGVGKTVVTAALAAAWCAAGCRVTVVKPAQTGVGADEPGDMDEVRRLVGPLGGTGDIRAGGDGEPLSTVEPVRLPDPLAPATAARLAGVAAPEPRSAARRIVPLAVGRDLLLVEGAGGLLVPFDSAGGTIADLADELGAELLVVTGMGLGAINATALTVEAIRNRGLPLRGLVWGAVPRDPDLAERTNREDMARWVGIPVVGGVPEGAALLPPARFGAEASGWFAPEVLPAG
ncbi:dethiobiotin synthase [Streptomyces sp. ST2-7A]|uniref:dethiobiotin synthase n=1 Tax=Streptomyces sp. ST2-7A TaxID=2907214 RepID=UPI001F1C7C08|nr:dethiobiotin synthase [Streptomyces sp. ST2-7A]MCE7079644.1 dethiobiotin synthase [Streptomyces sp. ST2-7A]